MSNAAIPPRRRRRPKPGARFEGLVTTPLYTIRKARTMTQGQVAGLLGVKQQTYSDYESGRRVPPPDRRARLAILLGTMPEVLWPPREGLRRPA